MVGTYNLQTITEHVLVRVTIDEDGIARKLGAKAARNAVGKATALYGLVKVEVIQRNAVIPEVK